MSNQTEPVPAGHMRDAKGRLVPERLVKPIDRLRDQTVQKLVEQAKHLSAVLATFKRLAFGDIEALVATSAEEYGVTISGKKGNLTLYSYDGQYKVVRQVADRITYDERMQAAKALIDEFIGERVNQGVDEDLRVLVMDAFRVDKQGALALDRVLGLRRLSIQHPKWLRAMDAISDSLQVVGCTSYVRVYERVGDSEQYRVIPLDIAGV